MKRISAIAQHTFLVLVSVVVLLQFFWIVSAALKPLAEAVSYPPTFFPHSPTLSNFIYVLTRFTIIKHYYLNSVIVSVVTVPLVMIIACLAGYSFARLRTPGRDKIFWALVATMFFPLSFARLLTVFELTEKLNLFDTKLGLILPYLSLDLVMYTFIMRANFKQIPQELEDAARIDGCSTLQTFLRIMLPLARNGVAVVAVLCFINIWGEYLYAFTLTLDKALTLPVGLSVLNETSGGETAFHILAAGYTLAILPPLALFIVAQRLFMRGLTQGALKF
jgi:multiple sugar transport system permease protein